MLQRRGCAVAHVGGSSSVLAAGGLGSRSVNLAIWDTLAPPQSACIATLLHHQVGQPMCTGLRDTAGVEVVGRSLVLLVPSFAAASA